MMQLKELRLVGPGAEPAIVTFEGGLNVVTGASNTGKSYILRCIDYILGAEKMTKVIDEARPYDRIFLQIRNSSGDIMTLERSLSGGEIALHRRSIDQITDRPDEVVLLKRGKSSRPDLSSSLMKFCGIPEAQVRSNAQGEKQRLSFRMISHLFMVDENTIIEERSPLLADGGYDKTARVNAFSFMLTGKDDSSIITSNDPKLVKTAAKAKLEVIDELLAPLEKRLSQLPQDDRSTNERTELLDKKIAETSGVLTEDEHALSALRAERSDVLARLQKADSQIVALEQVQRRFELLAERYTSDLSRLDFMSETSHYFGQLQETNCPLCGQALGPEHLVHVQRSPDLKEVQRAARGEAAKIRGLQKELELSRQDLANRVSNQRALAQSMRGELARFDGLLQEKRGPRFRELREQLQELMAARVSIENEHAERQQVEHLRSAKREIEEQENSSSKRREWGGLDQIAVDRLCREIETVLAQWGWPRPGRVSFDFKENDIMVDGKPRQSNGKGVRAILHAAFSVGLLKYAAVEGKPHPGFLVLDSPLTTYKQGRTRDGSEALGEELEQAFFNVLADTPKSLQIIVLDNKIPSPDLQMKLHYEYFSGVADEDRQGFIPALAHREV